MTSAPATDALAELFWTVARRLRTSSMTTLAQWDVTPSQMRAVRVLTKHGELRSSDLAAHLGIAPRSATEVVDALEAKALVRRTPDPTDRRATLVGLTATGEELSEEVRRARGLESERVFERLSATDRGHLERILRSISEQ